MPLPKETEQPITRARSGDRDFRAALSTGIDPLDERLGGLRVGGSYLLAGMPGSGRFVALLQYLSRGLEEGRVGLVTAAPRGRILEESDHWGFGLRHAWKSGHLGILTYKADFQRRLLSAADPAEIFQEMEALLGEGIQRLALYPATPLWETRAGTSLASHVVNWLDAHPATTLAAVGGDLESGTTPASDWVANAASGVFSIERLPSGLRQIWVKRMTPPARDDGPVTLELVPGRGYQAPSGSPDRRSTDRPTGSQRNVLLIRMTEEAPRELSAWLERWYETTTVAAPFEAMEELQAGRFGLVLVYLSRDQMQDGIRATRVIRKMAPTPVILATTDRVRSDDRVKALEAGASDFLSDPLSVGELASRAEKAIIAGAPLEVPGEDRLPPPGPGTVSGGGGSSFERTVRARLESPRGSLFTFLHLPSPSDPERRQRLWDVLAAQIRDEDGDLLGGVADGIGLVLQGTEVHQAHAFLQRVRRDLGEDAEGLDFKMLSGALDGERIREILAAERR
jgi:CheY-like chemotaxis protein